MRCFRLLFAILVLFAAAGCGTLGNVRGAGSTVQRLLDDVLPPDFTGDANLSHSNGYFRIAIRAGNLRRTDRGWSWTWLVWYRKGVVSDGTVIFGSPPTHLIPP